MTLLSEFTAKTIEMSLDGAKNGRSVTISPAIECVSFRHDVSSITYFPVKILNAIAKLAGRVA